MDERDVKSRSLDTIDDSLSVCDSKTEEGPGYARQQSVDAEDSHATTARIPCEEQR